MLFPSILSNAVMKNLSKTGLGILTLQTFVLCEKKDLKAETGTKSYILSSKCRIHVFFLFALRLRSWQYGKGRCEREEEEMGSLGD